MVNRISVFNLMLWVPVLGFGYAAYGQEPSSEAVSPATATDPRILIHKATSLIQTQELNQAKEILTQLVEKEKDSPPRPYVKDGILYMYFHDQGEFLIFSMLDTLPQEEQKRLKENIWSEIIELEKKETWNSVVYEHPTAPKAFQLLSYIAVEENKIEEALEYLDRSLYYWDDFMLAHAEYVYILIRTREYEKAKARAKSAIENQTSSDKDSLARLYRHLGYTIFK